MKVYKCKYCSRPMNVNGVEYKSNSYCNNCFEDRVREVCGDMGDKRTFLFMGETFNLDE